MKKSTKKPAKSGKDTGKVVQPEIKSTISMQLTHNDVIDVAVQETIEKLDNEIITLKTQIQERKNAFDIWVSDVFINPERVKTGNPVIAAFLAMDEKITEKYSVNTKETKEFETYKKIEVNEINRHQYKNIQSIKSNFYRSHNKAYRTVECIDVSLEKDYNNKMSITVELTPEEKEIYRKEYRKYTKELVKLYNLLFEKSDMYINYVYNEKSIRSKFVKQALKSTEEGKVFLNLLETATKVKLLN